MGLYVLGRGGQGQGGGGGGGGGGGTVNDRTSVGGGQGTETEGVVDRVLKARAGMKGGRGEEGVGA